MIGVRARNEAIKQKTLDLQRAFSYQTAHVLGVRWFSCQAAYDLGVG